MKLYMLKRNPHSETRGCLRDVFVILHNGKYLVYYREDISFRGTRFFLNLKVVYNVLKSQYKFENLETPIGYELTLIGYFEDIDDFKKKFVEYLI